MIPVCPICSRKMTNAFSAVVLERHEAHYDYCEACGFLRVRNPHWIDEAYSSAIAISDTGLVLRNIDIAKKLTSVLFFLLGERGQGRYLDAAGGYGLLVRLMRDYGFDFYWSDKYCENLLARGFEYTSELGECAAVTAVEIMEHVEDPTAFVQDAMKMAQSNTFLFTTALFEGSPPPRDWWYYSFETGQHISLYQRRTLETIARTLGLSLVSGGGLHMFSKTHVSETAFRALAGRLSAPSSSFARRRLGTLAMQDHKQMVERLRKMPATSDC